VWDNQIRAFLGGPPDRVLDPDGSASRAASYIEAAGSTPADPRQGAGILADWRSHLPVGPSSTDDVVITHPIGTVRSSLRSPPCNPSAVTDAIAAIVSGRSEDRQRFLALWRLLPERLEQLDPFYGLIPAETAVPDHSAWHAADSRAAFAAASSEDGLAAFLSVSIGPVQAFIANARSLRDLWSGSAILSWLTWHAMLPVVERLGPAALIFPALRGMPLCDAWLERQAGLAGSLPATPEDCSRIPALPNRFLALVPSSSGAALARRCEQAARDAWHSLSSEVRARLSDTAFADWPGWDHAWDDQVGHVFNVRSVVLPWQDQSATRAAQLLGYESADQLEPTLTALARLGGTDARDRDQTAPWSALVDIVARLGDAARLAEPVSNGPVSTDGPVPMKCTMFGTYEQLGPHDLAESREYWAEIAANVSIDGVRIRPGERLCAVALVKRFASTGLMADDMGVERAAARLPDLATVAATGWLRDADIRPDDIRHQCGSWSGQWLHDREPSDEPAPDEVAALLAVARRDHITARPPPSYLAVIAMDADRIGTRIRGEVGPCLADILRGNPNAPTSLEPALLASVRPVGPQIHGAISEALLGFALGTVPETAARFGAEVVYAGGDDVLALCDTASAIAFAEALHRGFRGLEDDASGLPRGYTNAGGRVRPAMADGVTISAGIAIVHIHDDLRLALEAARGALTRSKASGRNLFTLMTCRRSGEHASVTLPWSIAGELDCWRKAFLEGASDRWAYALREISETMTSDTLPDEAMADLLRARLARSDENSRKLLGDLPEQFLKLAPDLVPPTGIPSSNGNAFASFLTAILSASFMARRPTS
jgi:CRISPR-associated protein Cmr2